MIKPTAQHQQRKQQYKLLLDDLERAEKAELIYRTGQGRHLPYGSFTVSKLVSSDVRAELLKYLETTYPTVLFILDGYMVLFQGRHERI